MPNTLLLLSSSSHYSSIIGPWVGAMSIFTWDRLSSLVSMPAFLPLVIYVLIFLLSPLFLNLKKSYRVSLRCMNFFFSRSTWRCVWIFGKTFKKWLTHCSHVYDFNIIILLKFVLVAYKDYNLLLYSVKKRSHCFWLWAWCN